MTKARQVKLLLKCVSILSSVKFWKDTDASFYWNLVKFAHTHGYLYVGFNGDDIDLVVVAYRVKGLSDEDLSELPKKEDGDILYVLIAVSVSKDKFKMNKLRKYFLSNNKDVTKIALHHRGDKDKLKIYEVQSGKTIEA